MKKRLLLPLAALCITGYSIRGAALSDDENIYPGINYLIDDEPISFGLETPKEDLALLNGIEKYDYTSVQRALSRGADPDAVSSDGNTALTLAIEKESPKIVATLLAKNADVNKQNAFGYTPLMAALEALADRSRDIIEPIHSIIVQLMQKGAGRGLLLRNRIGQTALHIAAAIDDSNFYGNTEKILKALVKVAGPKGIKAQDNDGNTPLMIAASYDNTEFMHALFAAEVDGEALNHQNNEGNTALMIALENGHLEPVDALLDRGAQVSQTNNKGERALIIAMKYSVIDDDTDENTEQLQRIIQTIAAREAEEWR